MMSWGLTIVSEDEGLKWPEPLQTVFCDVLASAGAHKCRRWGGLWSAVIEGGWCARPASTHSQTLGCFFTFGRFLKTKL